MVQKRIFSSTVYILIISLVSSYTLVFCCSAQEPSPSNSPTTSHIQYSFWYPNGSIMPNPQINLPISVAEAPASGSYSFNVCLKNDGNVPINVGYVGFQNIQLPTGVSIRTGNAQYFGMGSPVEVGQNYTGSLTVLFSVAKGTYTFGSSFNYSFDLVFRAYNANDKTGTCLFQQALHVTGSATYPIEQATPTPATPTPSPTPTASSAQQQNDATQSSLSTTSPAASNNHSQTNLAADPSQATTHASTAPEEAIPELPSVGFIIAFMALISAGTLTYTLKRHRRRQK